MVSIVTGPARATSTLSLSEQASAENFVGDFVTYATYICFITGNLYRWITNNESPDILITQILYDWLP